MKMKFFTKAILLVMMCVCAVMPTACTNTASSNSSQQGQSTEKKVEQSNSNESKDEGFKTTNLIKDFLESHGKTAILECGAEKLPGLAGNALKDLGHRLEGVLIAAISRNGLWTGFSIRSESRSAIPVSARKSQGRKTVSASST